MENITGNLLKEELKYSKFPFIKSELSIKIKVSFYYSGKRNLLFNMKKLFSLTLSTLLLSGMAACTPSGNIFQINPSSENGYLAQRAESLATINSKYTAEGLSKVSLNLKLNRNLSKGEIKEFADKYNLKVTITID